MTSTNFVKQRSSVIWKKLLPAIKHSKIQRKIFFRSIYSGSKSFFYELLFRQEFQSLLIGWDPAKNLLVQSHQ